MEEANGGDVEVFGYAVSLLIIWPLGEKLFERETYVFNKTTPTWIGRPGLRRSKGVDMLV